MTQINTAPNPNVPDAYIQALTPRAPLVAGVQTNLIGVVGTASWGPVNSPKAFSTPQDYAVAFGAIQARKYDMGTAAIAAMLQGAVNFQGVRVTDGTDVAASVKIGLTGVPTLVGAGTGYVANDTITLANGAILTVLTVSTGAVATVSVATQPTTQTAGTIAQTATSGVGTGATFSFVYANGVTATSKYSGSGANADTVTVATGSAANTKKITITRPGLVPEVFDNIAGSANALWIAIANAVNNGISGLRGPSNLMVFTAGTATIAPTNATSTLTGGTDGTTTITGSVMIGTDGVTRSGMYALRGVGPAILVLADCDDSTTWTTQVSFALSEGHYSVMTGPSGEYTGPATVASNKASAGIDSYAAKLLVGDWCYWLDTYNGGAQRLISPQGFAAGVLAARGPEQSGLNKPIVGIVGTQKSSANQRYSQAELAIFGAAGLDLICNPAPGGSYFALRFGQNTSSNAAINGDNYSRMVPYLEYSFSGVAGQVVGQVQTSDLRANVTGAVDAFLYGLWKNTPPMISNPQNTQPYSIQCNDNNNPPSRVALGYLQMDVKVQLGPIVRLFILNVEAGQTVQVTSQLAA